MNKNNFFHDHEDRIIDRTRKRKKEHVNNPPTQQKNQTYDKIHRTRPRRSRPIRFNEHIGHRFIHNVRIPR